jgi:hypothetical protein
MTESDFEYLTQTLSEARSLATELTVAVRWRAGADHRLAELGLSAVSNIEKLLREVRGLAMDQVQYHRPLPATDPIPRAAAVSSGHWLQSLIDELIAYSRAHGEVSFEIVERLLQRHKETFLKDLETARRMYRVYPHLFPAEGARKAGTGRVVENNHAR